MSFSSEIKREICLVETPGREAKLAELAAMTENSADIRLCPSGIRIQTENAMAIARLAELMRDVFYITIEVRGRYGLHGSKARSYEGVFADRDAVFDVLGEIGFLRGDDETPYVEREPDPTLLETMESKRAYLRGAFLCCGSCTAPKKKPHFEMVCRSEAFAKRLQALMEEFDIHPRILERRRESARPAWVVYLKKNSEISDALNVIGAHKALLNFEEVQVERDFRNLLNRQVNFEAANLNKTARAALKVNTDINYLIETKHFSELAPALQEIAGLRLENPFLSLEDLGELLDPPLGKSGVNHRLKKISEIADEYRGTSAQ